MWVEGICSPLASRSTAAKSSDSYVLLAEQQFPFLFGQISFTVTIVILIVLF
jgi:hypothetical protein